MTTDASDTGTGAGAGTASGANANAEIHEDVSLLTNGIENAAAAATSAGQNTTDTNGVNGVSSDVLKIIGENNVIKEPFRTGQSLATSAVGFDDIIYAEWFQKLLNNNPDAAGTLLSGMVSDWPDLVGTRWFQNLRTSSDPAAFGRFCQGFLLPKPVPTRTVGTSAFHISGTTNGDEGSGKKKSTTTSSISTSSTSSSSTDATPKSNANANSVKAKLPPAMLASILDFMEYGDVRGALCSGKYVAVDAAKYIKTINIMRECQLFTGPLTKSVTSRFSNVKEVNCLCLVRVDDGGAQRLSIKAATRLVPFLLTFPKLSSAFVGGTGPGGRFEYDAQLCVSPDHHEEAIQELAEHLRGAIRSGALPYRLSLGGVPNLAYNDSAAPLPVLPPDAMGSVLDFATYHDIQTAVRTSESIFGPAIGHVRVLTIMHPSELSISRTTNPLIHRFGGVKEVNCFCFVVDNGEDNSRYDLSFETVAQIVPFLVTFPKLSVAFLGRWSSGRYGGSEECYLYPESPAEINRQEGEFSAFRGLVEQFCGAFESGALPSNLDLKGLLACQDDHLSGFGLERISCTGGSDCRSCSRICSSFPFNVVVRLVGNRSTCIPDAVRISALRDRPNSTECFRSEAAIDGLLRMLSIYTNVITIRKRSESLRDQNFVQRMRRRGRKADSRGDYDVQYLPGRAKDQVRAIVTSGFEMTLDSAPSEKLMSSVSAYYFSRKVWRNGAWSIRRKAIWVRSSLNFLISLGFDLDPDDFFLVDPCDEPAVLQRMEEEEEE